MKTATLKHEKLGISQKLTKRITTVGRSEDCDFTIPSEYPDVSRRHCLIEINQNGKIISIKDNGSTNGTFLNGRKLSKKEDAPLSDDDKIRLGNSCTLKISIKDDDNTNHKSVPSEKDLTSNGELALEEDDKSVEIPSAEDIDKDLAEK